MKKIVTIFVVVAIVFTTSLAAFSEKAKKDFKTKIYFSVGNAALCPGDEFSFSRSEDGSIELYHKSGLFSAVISYDRMDSETLELLRKYYNDYSSGENFMFSRFIEFGMSFFNSMEELFRSNFLYPEENQLEESNMKIFGKYSEYNLSKSSYSIIYNTIYTDKTTSLENTHINIAIPIASDKTVYLISFTCQKGALDNYVMENMLSLINSLEIPGAYKQVKTLNVFNDINSINLANQGIYPDLDAVDITYYTFINQNGGYSIRYPSTLIKYRTNNITDAMNYVSFKINYNHTISISTEKLQQPFSIDNMLNLLKNSKEGYLTVQEKGILNIAENGNNFEYIKYEISSPEGRTYVQDYFLIHNSRLFSIRLESRFIQASDVIVKVLYDILESLQFTDIDVTDPADIFQNPSRFTNKRDGFTLLYPNDWKVIKNSSAASSNDTYILQPHSNSSSLEVMLVESELTEGALISNGKDLCANENPLIIKYLSNGYKAPYIGKTFTSLYTSSYKHGEVLYIKRLINYLDDAGRSRMCYSMDIIQERNIYSLFISSPDYFYSEEGKEFNENATAAAKLISNSFSLVNTPGYEEKQHDNFDNNAIFTQCILYLNDILGTNVKGYFPNYNTFEPISTEKSELYVPVYAEFYNSSGFFVLLVNTVDNTITIVEYTPADSE